MSPLRTDDVLRVGLVGCGGRGTGAAEDCMKADPAVRLVALADSFSDRLEKCRTYLAGLKNPQFEVDDSRCFSGYDAYRRLFESGVDLVLLCTPPGFRPAQFEEAVAAGKHVFFEKPIAVDPVGVRRVLAAGAVASEKKLGVVTGTIYRHTTKFIETVQRIHDGAIGKVVSGRCWYNTGALWRYDRKSGDSDLDYQVRNWLYFDWLSGDHIVEQHVHTIDVTMWVMGGAPARASGVGGRAVRTGPEYGNIWDHFVIDYEWPGGARVQSMCRQWENAHGEVGAWFRGTEGVASPYEGTITGKNAWKFEGKSPNAYVQEHRDLIASIRSGTPLNETKQIAASTLMAILGREAAYTGKTLTFDEMLASGLDLSPPKRPDGVAVRAVPVPGTPRA